MDDDSTLRAVLIVVVLVLLAVGMYRRYMSQSSGERLDRRQEGLFVLATLRPLGAALWLSAFAWMIDPGWMAWSSLPLPLWARWVGVGAPLTGAALLLWTFRSLGTNLTDTVVTRRTHHLIVHGPYRLVRHPLYSSAALLVAGVSLIASNWFLFGTGIAVLCVLILRTRTEEENLVARFGENYRRYMGRTGRFVPRVGTRWR
jgi:protein-S-isoprenylcysteine O-methyltransferase Ste14